MTGATRGFILQPTYRIEGGRPVVLLSGKLEDGGSFLVRDKRQVPHFWVRTSDVARAAQVGATVVDEPSPRVTMRGEPVSRVDVIRPGDVPDLRDRLIAAGVPCYEADVRFAYRYLIERGIRAAIAIDGEWTAGAGVHAGIDRVYENPQVERSSYVADLSVLSFDIETDPRASRLLSLAIACGDDEEVLLVTPEGMTCPPNAVACPTEADLLRRFVERVREIDPDLITGWNVVDFDLSVLQRIGERVGVPMTLGRGTGPLRLRSTSAPGSNRQASIPGRVVIDGIDMLRGAFVRLDEYSLNFAANEILGKQKTITGSDRAGEILEAFERDRQRLVDYNLHDARLVLEILEKLHLVELTVQRSLLTGMPPDRVAASVASFDFLYLSRLGERGVAAPTVQDVVGLESQAGGHVLDPEPGLYRNVLMLDFRSLYPSIIRTFQIDPAGLIPEPGRDDDPIVAPNGAAFSREPGILPGLLDELFPQRAAAKAAGDGVASHAIKILMNSFYGVLGTSACRFASPTLVNAITGFGREILLWARDRIEGEGLRVLYGDTDSLFVEAGTENAGAADALGRRLVTRLNDELAEHIRQRWRVESRLELEYEKLYLRLLLPAIRHGTGGARKRYAGLVRCGPAEDATEVEFTGLEVVRRDWTELAKQVQREVYERLFADRPIEDYVRRTVEDLRGGKLDELLVYRKGRRRRLDSYTATTPPHIAAARKMSGKPGRVIAYVITRDGPEPAAERRSELDHEHYVQKQVRAVAEPVLALLGLDFDRVIGDDRQMTLF